MLIIILRKEIVSGWKQVKMHVHRENQLTKCILSMQAHLFIGEILQDDKGKQRHNTNIWNIILSKKCADERYLVERWQSNEPNSCKSVSCRAGFLIQNTTKRLFGPIHLVKV